MSRRKKERPCKKHGGNAPNNDYCAQPDWERQCEVCSQSPVICCTGLCGPCTFGEAATAGGNW